VKRKGFSGEENLLKVNVEEFEKHIIVSALARTCGNQSLAAKHLGTTNSVISHRIRKYNIGLEQFYNKNRNKHQETTAAAASFNKKMKG
jgi:transcriptional regulator with GAF, ATPase, and Fis domain